MLQSHQLTVLWGKLKSTILELHLLKEDCSVHVRGDPLGGGESTVTVSR